MGDLPNNYLTFKNIAGESNFIMFCLNFYLIVNVGKPVLLKPTKTVNSILHNRHARNMERQIRENNT